jgi:hypothetical protein
MGSNRYVLGVLVVTAALSATLVFPAGCAFAPQGATDGGVVPSERRVSLTEGGNESNGQWQGQDLRLAIHYRLGPGSLQLMGHVELAGHLQHYDRLESLTIHAHLLDDSGRILVSRQIFSAGFNTPMWFMRWDFEKQLPLMPEATALTFSYSGRAASGGGRKGRDRTEGGISWDFWQTPY